MMSIGPQLLQHFELHCPKCGRPMTGDDVDEEKTQVYLFGGKKLCSHCKRPLPRKPKRKEKSE